MQKESASSKESLPWWPVSCWVRFFAAHFRPSLFMFLGHRSVLDCHDAGAVICTSTPHISKANSILDLPRTSDAKLFGFIFEPFPRNWFSMIAGKNPLLATPLIMPMNFR